MGLSSDAVLALAPDSSSATAGKKLAHARHWKNLGQNEQALWGECQGSALYQVRADRVTLTIKCSCPSRKLPCKHGLGLLLLAAAEPASLISAEPPEWVASWLAKRTASATPAQPKEAKTTPEQIAAEAAKRAEKRLAQVRVGLDSLDRWMNDLVRNGLASIETAGTKPWEEQAARLVDAQAPGLAARLRAMAQIPGASGDWPERLLRELGKLTLLSQAFRRLEALDPALREDVRQLIGWSLKEDEVAARGEHVQGEWVVLGQWVDDSDPRLRTQRTWLAEATSGRLALILQFSVMNQPFGEAVLPGTRFPAELHYWPSAYPQRARIAERRGEPQAISSCAAGAETVEAYLDTVAAALARQPWLDRFPCLLRGVMPYCADGGETWRVCDRAGVSVPLAGDGHWRLLALSGGAPVDLAGEWDGEAILPLGMVADGAYTPLWGVS